MRSAFALQGLRWLYSFKAYQVIVINKQP
jgi:hypothetical protein